MQAEAFSRCIDYTAGFYQVLFSDGRHMMPPRNLKKSEGGLVYEIVFCSREPHSLVDTSFYLACMTDTIYNEL